LTTLLKESREVKLPVFFILDEFHEFAQQNVRQTLLYLLGDLLQDKSAQIALIGLTCRVDAHRVLEKRIRSRMSFRTIIVGHLPTVDLLKESIHSSLCLPLIPQGDEDKFSRDLEFPDPRKITNGDITHHNQCVNEFLSSTVFLKKLTHIHSVGRDHRWINTALSLTLSRWNYDSDFPPPHGFVESCEYLSRDRLIQELDSCTVAEMCLVVSMIHLDSQEKTSYNFLSVFNAYHHYMKTNEPDSIDRFTKVHMFNVFETLLHRHLLKPASDGKLESYTKLTSLLLKQTVPVRFVIERNRARECLLKCKLPTWMDNWIRSGGDPS